MIMDIQYKEIEETWYPTIKWRASLIITGIWWLAIVTEFLVF